MIGISKERLIQFTANVKNSVYDASSKIVIDAILGRLIIECYELDPWLPIEDAPKDIPLLVYYPTMPKGLRFRAIPKLVNFDASIHKPTHYKELDDEPNPD